MLNNCPGTNICCKKVSDGDGEGVCNVNIINDKNIKNFNQLSDKINELGGCSLGLFSNFKPESTSDDNKVWLWDCGTTAHCSFTIEEDYKDILQTYVIDGNCDDPANQGFINIKLNEGQPDEYTRKVYCPAPLSFFTFWNIVAVLVVIGVVYVIMQHSKGKRKR